MFFLENKNNTYISSYFFLYNIQQSTCFFFENKNNASSPPISYFTTFNMFFFGKQKNTSILFTTLVSLLERNIKCENYVIVVKCKYSSPEWVAFVDIHFHTDLVASCGQQDKGLVWDTELFRSPPLHFFLKSLNKENKQNKTKLG